MSILRVDGQPVIQRRAVPNSPIELLDVGSRFHDDHESGKAKLIMETSQEIPESFVAMLRAMKADSGSVKEREFMHVASVPAVIWFKYLREGYDIFKEDVRETCKRLVKDGLDSFVVTNKRI